jgi:hypothetical protein
MRKIDHLIELLAATGAVAVFVGFFWTGLGLLGGALIAAVRRTAARPVFTNRTRRSSS